MPTVDLGQTNWSDWYNRLFQPPATVPPDFRAGMSLSVMHHDPYSAAPAPFVGQAPTLGKGYPADFTKLYNQFSNAYAQHPAEVANERASGGGPWTSQMQQLDDLKNTQDWVHTDAPRLKRLPLGAQQNIYDTPETPEGQVPLPPVDPSDPTGQTRARNYGEPIPPPANQYSPQEGDIDRLFRNQIWNGYLGTNAFGPTGGWGT